jgi:hypothetical protein
VVWRCKICCQLLPFAGVVSVNGKQARLQDIPGHHSSSLIVDFVVFAGVASASSKQARQLDIQASTAYHLLFVSWCCAAKFLAVCRCCRHEWQTGRGCRTPQAITAHPNDPWLLYCAAKIAVCRYRQRKGKQAPTAGVASVNGKQPGLRDIPGHHSRSLTVGSVVFAGVSSARSKHARLDIQAVKGHHVLLVSWCISSLFAGVASVNGKQARLQDIPGHHSFLLTVGVVVLCPVFATYRRVQVLPA